MRKPISRLFTCVYYVLGGVVRLLYPVRVEGLEELPQSKVLLCPNHTSNWDPILIALHLPVDYRLHTMAKEELFRNSILAWALRKMGGFPVNRGTSDIQAVKTAIQSIKDGDNLMIFPEGTVIRNGVGRMDGLPPKAKSGVAVIGVRTGATIIPVFVEELKLFRRTRIIFGKPYEPVYSGRHGTAEEMQNIAEGILETAYALGGQTVGGKRLCQGE